MKDEIKEINIPENVLVALGDLTNGAMNYYKNPKVIELKYKLLLDCITNLQEEKDSIDDYARHLHNENKILQEENEKLKEKIENLTHIVANKIIEDYDIDTPLKNQLNEERIKYINLSVVCNDYKSRNEKAKEFIEHENFKRTLLGFSENKYLKNIQKELLNILGGDDNE